SKDKMAVYLNECRRMGIKVLPPDVNESAADFTPVGTDVRFGLTAVRNVGANVVGQIVAARTEQGRYRSPKDFMEKVPLTACNKRLLDSLARAGAFDSMAVSRRALTAWFEDEVEAYVDEKRQQAIGQDSLFGGLDDPSGVNAHRDVPLIDEWDKQTLLGHEREMLGLYVSDHPLMGVEHVLGASTDCTIGELLVDDDRPDGSTVTVGGLVTAVQRKLTRRGDAWAVITLEDLEGGIDVMLFPSVYQLASAALVPDAIVLVKGRLRRRDDIPELHGIEVTVPDLSDRPAGPVVISLPVARCTPPVVEQLKDVLGNHPGVTEVHLRLQSQTSTKLMRLDDRLKVTPSPSLMADLKALLGPRCLTPTG
ncbi:MAG: OB-fold nucleic acid binding domain-containing protein, partial [Nocardioidaceae bacterium]